MPRPTDYTDRHQAYCAWLTANNIDPKLIPLDGDITIVESGGQRHIHYEALDLDADGRKHLDERRQKVAMSRRSTRLLVEPPDWWEPYEKPTRDDLLELLTQIRELAAAGPTSGAAIPGEWEFGWDAAMEAVVKLIGDKEVPQ